MAREETGIVLMCKVRLIKISTLSGAEDIANRLLSQGEFFGVKSVVVFRNSSRVNSWKIEQLSKGE